MILFVTNSQIIAGDCWYSGKTNKVCTEQRGKITFLLIEFGSFKESIFNSYLFVNKIIIFKVNLCWFSLLHTCLNWLEIS